MSKYNIHISEETRLSSSSRPACRRTTANHWKYSHLELPPIKTPPLWMMCVRTAPRSHAVIRFFIKTFSNKFRPVRFYADTDKKITLNIGNLFSPRQSLARLYCSRFVCKSPSIFIIKPNVLLCFLQTPSIKSYPKCRKLKIFQISTRFHIRFVRISFQSLSQRDWRICVVDFQIWLVFAEWFCPDVNDFEAWFAEIIVFHNIFLALSLETSCNRRGFRIQYSITISIGSLAQLPKLNQRYASLHYCIRNPARQRHRWFFNMVIIKFLAQTKFPESRHNKYQRFEKWFPACINLGTAMFAFTKLHILLKISFRKDKNMHVLTNNCFIFPNQSWGDATKIPTVTNRTQLMRGV